MKKKYGFTLVELVIVIAVIAVLTAVLVPTFAGIIERARESARLNQVTSARNEILSSNEKFNSIADLEGYLFQIENNFYQIETGEIVNITSTLDINEIKTTYIESTEQSSNSMVKVYEPKEIVVEPIYLDFTLDEDNKTATVIGYNGDYQDELVIPSYIQGVYGTEIIDGLETIVYCTGKEVYKVVAIANSAFIRGSMTSLVLPRTIESVGNYAFNYCSKLEDVYYYGTIEEWCQISFGYDESAPMYYATNFYMLNNEGEWFLPTEIEIPNSITVLKDRAFRGFSQLTKVTIPSGVTKIEFEVFSYCTNLQDINLPDTLTYLDSYAFAFCTNLEFIDFPNSLKSISNHSFYNCESLTSIYIPASVTSISNSTFACCGGLTEITVDEDNSVYDSRNDCNAIIKTNKNSLIRGCLNTIIPDDVTIIEDYSFNHVEFVSINLPSGITSIGNYAFEYSTLESINLPDGITKIGSNAFSYCGNLKSVNVPDSVVGLGSTVFYYCTNMESVTLPKNLTKIGTYMFAYCSNLESIELPNAITNIERSAFYDCVSLTSIIIPASVTTISSQVFYRCSKLTSITFEHSQEDTLTLTEECFHSAVVSKVSTEIYVNDLDSINSAISNYAWKSSCREVTYIELPQE